MYFRLITAFMCMLMCATFASAAPFAYITNLSDNTVSVIDTLNNGYIKKVALGTGQEPYAVAVSKDGARVYVSNQISKTISIIDALTDTANPTLIGTIGPLANTPRGIAINPAGTRLYVANYDALSISVIDLTTTPPTVLSTPGATTGTAPTGVAVNPAGTLVYVTNSGSDTVSVIDTATNSAVLPAIALPANSNPMGIAVDATNIYVANYNSNTVSVINASTKVVTPVTVGSKPFGMAVNAAGTKAFVTNSGASGGDSVSIIDTATLAVTPVSLGTARAPLGVSVTPDGFHILAANNLGNSVAVIDTNNNNAVETLVNIPGDPNFGNFFNSPQSLGNFVGPMLYAITAHSGPNGTIAPSVTLNKVTGSSQLYTFTPNANYRIDKVYVDGTIMTAANGVIFGSGSNSSSYTFNNIIAPHDVQATFIKDFDYVTITKSGIGTGTVTSTTSPANVTQLNCGGTCTVAFNNATQITLTATPTAGQYFTGWVGDTTYGNVCNGVTTNTCTFAMSGYTHVEAVFTTVSPSDKVWKVSPSAYYSTLQDCFNTLSAGATTVETTTEAFNEAYNLNTAGAVLTLKGGYNPDRSYSEASRGTAPTLFQGTFTITNGTLIADNIAKSDRSHVVL